MTTRPALRSPPPGPSTPFDAAALQSLLRGRDTWTVD